MKKLLLKSWLFIMKKIHKLNADVDRLLPVASNVVEAVKSVLANPAFGFAAEIVKRLIPGAVDDMVIDRAIQLGNLYIPRIALQLKIVNDLTGIADPNDQLIEVFKHLESVSNHTWEKFCTQLAQQVLIDLAVNDDTPKVITWGEAGVYVELYYKAYLK